MTAIDWFFKQILGSLHVTMTKDDIDNVLQQAKELEKKQISDAWLDGYRADLHVFDSPKEYSLKYYNNLYENGTSEISR